VINRLRAWWLLSFDPGRCAEIVLMDKPFGALDATTRAGLTQLSQLAEKSE
jgi:ABC-type nitrate/sulfonate/bicarbonate transport system ATPase subunit